MSFKVGDELVLNEDRTNFAMYYRDINTWKKGQVFIVVYIDSGLGLHPVIDGKVCSNHGGHAGCVWFDDEEYRFSINSKIYLGGE